MSDKEVERRLIARGVPRHIAAYVAAQRPLRIPMLGSVGFMAVMTGGFAVGGFWLWPVLEARLEQNALTAALASGALLYEHNFGVGLLIALFAWIGATGFIIGAIPMMSRRLAAGAFYESILNGSNATSPLARWAWEKTRQQLQTETDPERYIHRATFSWLKPAGIFAAIALTAAAVVTARELHTYTLFFADHYEQRHTFLPSPTVRAWANASRVEVGCNHVTGEDAGDDAVYDVHFRDGGAVRVDGAIPVSMTWIDQVETIDAALVQAGAQFEPWSWLNRDAYHPRCLMAYAVWLGDERYARFQRLIRAPDMTRDVVGD